MNLQTPLARARGLGSAKQGIHHWYLQRLTAVALVPLSLWFIYSLITLANIEYQTLTTWLKNQFNVTLILLFIFSLYYHVALGIQIVIEDYIHSKWLKINCLLLVKFIVWLAVVSTTIAVLKIHMG